MAGRKISNQQRAWLVEELTDWRTAGIVSSDQAERILHQYESTAESGERKRILASFAFMGVAGLLVGLSLLLLIGYNWEELPRAAKLALIFGITAGTYTGGIYLRFRRQALLASEIVLFLGCLCYGGAIMLIAQIFHLDAHYPDGIWWWAIGVLPFALCLDTLLLHGLLVALLALWAGTEVLGFPDLGGWLFGRWSHVPNGAYSLPLLALPGLLWAYRKGSAAAIVLYAPLLAWWVILQPFAWHMEQDAVFFIGSIGALFLMIAESHRSGSPLAIPYRLYGVLMTVGVLVPLSYFAFNAGWRSGTDSVSVYLSSGLAPVLLLVMVAGTIGLLAKIRQHQEGKPIGEAYPLTGRILQLTMYIMSIDGCDLASTG